ncbi:hypothetical protein B0H13DRAFT_2517730 [Mycena leptocephala]|nr:hypothetical protein B0H13DRAFT_2517730 [Mycena leptocephala]
MDRERVDRRRTLSPARWITRWTGNNPTVAKALDEDRNTSSRILDCVGRECKVPCTAERAKEWTKDDAAEGRSLREKVGRHLQGNAQRHVFLRRMLSGLSAPELRGTRDVKDSRTEECQSFLGYVEDRRSEGDSPSVKLGSVKDMTYPPDFRPPVFCVKTQDCIAVVSRVISVFIGIQVWQQDGATVPPRILEQRGILAASWFAFSSVARFSMSSTHNLLMILSLALSSVIAGGILTAVGYHTLFMILASILTAVGAGLLSTVNTSHAHRIGYQVIYGLALGGGIQLPINAVQRILEPQNVAIGSSLILFMQTLGPFCYSPHPPD